MGNELLMPFLTDSPEFTQGFECGMIWEKIKAGECFDYHPIHTANADQMNLIGEALGAVVEVTPGDDTWSFITVKSAIHGI